SVDLTTAKPSLALVGQSDSGISSTDGITNSLPPYLPGTAEAGASVTLYDGATALGTADASSQGTWSIAAPSLAEGTHPLTAMAVHRAGNSSPLSDALTVTIDRSAAVPSLRLATASD